MVRATPLRLAWLSSILFAAAGIWNWINDPNHAAKWLVAIVLFPALWGLIELRLSNSGCRNRELDALVVFHRKLLAGVGFFLTFSSLLKLAASGGTSPEWMPVAVRARGLLVGLGILLWGNRIPKLLSPWGVEDEPFDWQHVHRFAGTAAVLGGLALLLVWLSFPLAEAGPASRAITLTLFGLILGRKLISVLTVTRRQLPPSSPHRADDPA